MTETASTVAANLVRQWATLARDIKIAHTVFAMPFALLATFLAAASRGTLPAAVTLGLIVLCMFSARTVAMAVNRLADASIDAANPRTASRAIPAGELTRRFVMGIALGCSAAFIIATGGFWIIDSNPWPLILAPVVLAYLAGYSFTKRITWLCHLALGGALALSPLAAVIAVAPQYLAEPAPYLLAGVVLCWVAGFDVIYALQDYDFDRAEGLFSMPASLGIEPALWISRALHVAVAGGLVALIIYTPQLSSAFAVAVAVAVALLALEHALVWGSRNNRIHIAFFTVNGIISLLLGGLGILDVIWRLYG